MKLYKHQQTVIKQAKPILEKYGLVYLSMFMRTGKTLCALVLASETAKNEPVLFITKKKAIGSIESDRELLKSWGIEIDLTVINYESLHKLEMKAFKVICLDEIHTCGAYPKLNNRQKHIGLLFAKTKAKAILLSGTPNVESSAQIFHQFYITGMGPFKQFSSFYGWFKVFGIPNQKKFGPRLVNVYDEVKTGVINKAIEPYCISMTQEQADFKQKANIKLREINNHKISDWIRSFKAKRVAKIEDHMIVGEQIAQVLQKCHMIAGGTLIDDEEEVLMLPEEFDPWYRARWCSEVGEKYKQIIVLTQYIAERDLLLTYFEDTATDNLDDFKAGKFKYFVGSLISYSEGVDFSWLNGCMILYSLTWSGAKYLQVLDRMNNKKRVEQINVYIPILSNSLDQKVFDAVSNKQSFNASFYKTMNKT
jgi:hypothetical protein